MVIKVNINGKLVNSADCIIGIQFTDENEFETLKSINKKNNILLCFPISTSNDEKQSFNSKFIAELANDEKQLIKAISSLTAEQRKKLMDQLKTGPESIDFNRLKNITPENNKKPLQLKVVNEKTIKEK